MVATKLSTLTLQSLPKLQLLLSFKKTCSRNQIKNDMKKCVEWWEGN